MREILLTGKLCRDDNKKMPREILFRGKLRKDGMWCYGNLNVHKNDVTIITPDDTPLGVYGQVDPATVGQFTGLADKNGVKIFEGDIVRCRSLLDTSDMVVIFEEGEFRMYPYEKYREHITGCGFFALRCFEKEVIGNIHDSSD